MTADLTEADYVARVNARHWTWAVETGAGFTKPWLDLDVDLLRRCAAGQLTEMPAPLDDVYPSSVLSDIEGTDVLCLAAGGGQQSAIFALLGARVTVLDLTAAQLAGDRTAAAHYRYEVHTVQGDMRDLSCFADASFDLVYQAESMSWVPDAREVYAGVARVLRPAGLYRVSFANPATEFVEMDSWDGDGYRISIPYRVTESAQRSDGGGPDSMQFRHHMGEIFEGLIELGFAVKQVQDAPTYFREDEGAPATWDHYLRYVGGFAIVARKG